MDPSSANFSGREYDSTQNVWPWFDEVQVSNTSRASQNIDANGPSPSITEQSTYVTDDHPDECCPPDNFSNYFPNSTDEPGSASEHFWQDANVDSVFQPTSSSNYQPALTVAFIPQPTSHHDNRRRYTEPGSHQQHASTYRSPCAETAVLASRTRQKSTCTQRPGSGTFERRTAHTTNPIPSSTNPPPAPRPLLARLPLPFPATTTAPAPTPPNLFAHLQLSLSTPPLTSHPAPEPQKPTTRYQPHWTRSRGAQKEGWCGYCHPGRWLNLKRSTYCYHLRNHHGIGVDGAVLAGPVGWRVKSKDLGGGSGGGGGGGGGSHGGCGGGGGGGGGGEGRKGGAEWEAYCGECARWIGGNVRYRMEVSWFRHFAKHSDSETQNAKGEDAAAPTMASASTRP